MKVSAITPTADRPVAFELVERFMRRQTVQPDEWIVADGGEVPVACAMGQIHLRGSLGRVPAGAANFAHNLLNGIAEASGDLLIFIEDDDWLAPTHIERMVDLARGPGSLFGADDHQRYYNVAHRSWRVFNNVGASLCQTAMRRSILPAFEQTIRACLAKGTYGIDTTLWRATPQSEWAIAGAETVVGIKGLPGRAGLGVGHRPGIGWTPDPDLARLRAWIGDDASLYESFHQRIAA